MFHKYFHKKMLHLKKKKIDFALFLVITNSYWIKYAEMTNLEECITIAGEYEPKIKIQFFENVAIIGGNINETFVLPKMIFRISGSDLRLEIRSIQFSKWTMFSKILSLLRCKSDLYCQNDKQKKNVSSHRSPCTIWKWNVICT